LTTDRLEISTGAPWERKVGYSRAVRIGSLVDVSGTVAVDEDGKVIGAGDPYVQAKVIFEKIRKSLEDTGASINDVIRTRMYVTDISNWNEVGKAHGETFTEVKPATSLVEVSNLISPEYLVEIEALAVVGKGI